MSASPRGHEIVERVRNARENFGGCYPKKFGGAAAIEILRDELNHEDVRTSIRDVYVRGYSSEIDLLIPKEGALPWLELLYDPQEVAVALEVKKFGSYGEQGLAKIKDYFSRLNNLGIRCAYITFEDRENYRWRPRVGNVNARCFALAWHRVTNGPLLPVQNGEDWEAFVRFLRDAIAGT
jgi:hypothetical protein